jgi:hypothetical protein
MKHLGNFMGHTPPTPTTGNLGVAQGIWTPDEQYRFSRANTWPNWSAAQLIALTAVSQGTGTYSFPGTVQAGDLIVVIGNDGGTSSPPTGAGGSAYTLAFTTTTADFGYNFSAFWRVRTSETSVSANFGYTHMVAIIRGPTTLSSTFTQVNVGGGGTTNTSVAQSGVLIGFATDRGAGVGSTFSGQVFADYKVGAQSTFTASSTVALAYGSGSTVGCTDVNNSFGTQFVLAVAQ